MIACLQEILGGLDKSDYARGLINAIENLKIKIF